MVDTLENVQAFAVGLHQAVFDAVVHHLDKVARAGRAGVQIAVFRGRFAAFAAGRLFDGADAGRQGFEDWVQVVKSGFVAADHHAVAPVQAPNAAAGAHVDVADAFFGQRLGAAHVVLVIGVAAVNDDVAGLKQARQGVDRRLGNGACRQHDPDGARFLQLADKAGHVLAGRGALGGELGHAGGVGVIHDAVMSVAHQAAHDIAAHATQSNHSQLHIDSNLFNLKDMRKIENLL